MGINSTLGMYHTKCVSWVSSKIPFILALNLLKASSWNGLVKCLDSIFPVRWYFYLQLFHCNPIFNKNISEAYLICPIPSITSSYSSVSPYVVIFLYALCFALMGSRCPLLWFWRPLMCFEHPLLQFWHIILCILKLHLQVCWRFLLLSRPGWIYSWWLGIRFYPQCLIQPPIFGVINHSRIMSIIWWGVHICSRCRNLRCHLFHGLHWRRLTGLLHIPHHYPLMQWIITLLRNHRHKFLKCSRLDQQKKCPLHSFPWYPYLPIFNYVLWHGQWCELFPCDYMSCTETKEFSAALEVCSGT